MTKLSNKRFIHLHFNYTANRIDLLVDTLFKDDRPIFSAIRESLGDSRCIIGSIRSSGRYDTSSALIRWLQVVLSRDERRERRDCGQQGQDGGKGGELHVDRVLVESCE